MSGRDRPTSSPPVTEASTQRASGSRASTSKGPVKSSWVMRGKSAKTTVNGAGMAEILAWVSVDGVILRS